MWFNRKLFVSQHVVGHVDLINNRFYSHLFYTNIVELHRIKRVGFINVGIRDMMVRSYEKD
jgi:hypothetical protein